ncbi:Chromosome partition protein Smc [Pandoraea terrae]|uniref:Chromosome partition protein Smc n=1 Tax=Pandoraea terrae TaxID=1537710 RepID=A0A5E4UCW3_9BURK|nr:hypothetical protein [Pandoraea terrae]VVD97896.1 Chromosome partition protein Smc [Pandoraea terrae]
MFYRIPEEYRMLMSMYGSAIAPTSWERGATAGRSRTAANVAPVRSIEEIRADIAAQFDAIRNVVATHDVAAEKSATTQRLDDMCQKLDKAMTKMAAAWDFSVRRKFAGGTLIHRLGKQMSVTDERALTKSAVALRNTLIQYEFAMKALGERLQAQRDLRSLAPAVGDEVSPECQGLEDVIEKTQSTVAQFIAEAKDSMPSDKSRWNTKTGMYFSLGAAGLAIGLVNILTGGIVGLAIASSGVTLMGTVNTVANLRFYPRDPGWDKLEKAINAFKAFADEMERDMLTSNVANMTGRLANLQGNVSDVRSDVKGVRSELQSVQNVQTSSLSNMTGRLANLQGNVSDVRNDVKGVRSELQSVQNVQTSSLGRLANLQGNVSDVRNDVKGVRSELQSVQNMQTSNSAKLENLQGNISDVSGNVSTMQDDLHEVKSTVKPLQSAVDDLAKKAEGFATISDIDRLEAALREMVNVLKQPSVNVTIPEKLQSLLDESGGRSPGSLPRQRHSTSGDSRDRASGPDAPGMTRSFSCGGVFRQSAIIHEFTDGLKRVAAVLPYGSNA